MTEKFSYEMLERTIAIQAKEMDRMADVIRTERKKQPIATAPHDRKLLLRYAGAPTGEDDAFWIEGWWFEQDADWETAIGFIGEPTHWAELPR